MPVKIVIDGETVTATEGMTILAAANKAGIDIPNLCRVNDKNSADPCDLCVVEIEGLEGRHRSCETPVLEGMVVVSDSKALKEHRKNRLIRLAGTHFGDCKAPCNLTCPGQINVQGYIAHVAKGEYVEALRLVMERNPLPFSVGRICPRFCETRCRRILVDEPVSINHLKRFVADWCMSHNIDLKLECEPASGKRVAVIGGGPAGLTGAYYLARKGHDVTIYEAMPKLGGMLRYGLPEYKIPRDVVDHEINTILRLGISVKLSQKLGVDYTLEDLQDQGYDAILLATGAWKDLPLEVAGNTLPGVVSALEVLRRAALGKSGNYGRRAVVIGGNNIAMEAARTLLRLKVEQVTIIYPRAKTEMSANQRTIREAENEGVSFQLMASPIQIDEDKNALNLHLIRMKLGEPDSKGIRNPEAVPGSNFTMQVDTIVSSLGQVADIDNFLSKNSAASIELTPKEHVVANPRTSLTSINGVYAAGDITSGPRTLIQSVVAARRAAENIHAQIMDEAKSNTEIRFNFTRGKSFDEVHSDNFVGIEEKYREKMPERAASICTQDFDEVKLGFNESMARKEARRCLSCGCTAFDRCDLKRLSIEHGVDPNKTGMGTMPRYRPDDSHPTIRVDLNKCVYCMRCVNSCEYKALTLAAKKFDPQGRPEGLTLTFQDNCVSCGRCVDHCSTGALNKKESTVPVVNEQIREVRSTCPYCGAGCQIVLKVKGNTLMEVTADPEQVPNYGALCVKGRFGHNFVQHKDRLTKPLIRRNNRLVETTWDEALSEVAKRFFNLKAMYGPDSIAGFSCARATNEENYLMQKFMRTAIGTNNIDHCARL